MAWTLHEKVYYKLGTVRSNNIAAFDFDHTLAQSDSGLLFMRTEDDWVPTVSIDHLTDFFRKLVADRWTIVIFLNQYENDPVFTQKCLRRMDKFFNDIPDIPINSFMYVAIANDVYRKPSRGMWDLFTLQSKLLPSEASFFCGDAFGPAAINPAYRWSSDDRLFAEAIGLAYYTPEEMLGEFESFEVVSPYDILIVMAAHESQYQYIVDQFTNDGEYVTTSLEQAVDTVEALKKKVIIVGERMATRAGRRRVMHMLGPKYRNKTAILMFTRPIFPLIPVEQYRKDDKEIRGYANALDIHIQFNTKYVNPNEPFPIIRSN